METNAIRKTLNLANFHNKTENSEKNKSPPLLCYRCGQKDHLLKNCPKPYTPNLMFAPKKGDGEGNNVRSIHLADDSGAQEDEENHVMETEVAADQPPEDLIETQPAMIIHDTELPGGNWIEGWALESAMMVEENSFDGRYNDFCAETFLPYTSNEYFEFVKNTKFPPYRAKPSDLSIAKDWLLGFCSDSCADFLFQSTVMATSGGNCDEACADSRSTESCVDFYFFDCDDVCVDSNSPYFGREGACVDSYPISHNLEEACVDFKSLFFDCEEACVDSTLIMFDCEDACADSIFIDFCREETYGDSYLVLRSIESCVDFISSIAKMLVWVPNFQFWYRRSMCGFLPHFSGFGRGMCGF